MKHLLIALPLLFAPSCNAIDGALGLGKDGEPDRTEETISAGEDTIRDAGNLILPGAGGALAVLFGFGARAYVKRRKASKPAA